MIGSEEMQRLQFLRGRLFAHIDTNISIDGHHKRYEGTFEVVLPGRFDNEYKLHLSCYVVGPGRGQTWSGTSLSECLDKAEHDMEEWFYTENEGLLAMMED